MSNIKSLALIDTNKEMILPADTEIAVVLDELSDMDRIYFGRIKPASGGAGVFTVTEPGADDDGVAKTIDAVIIMSHKVNGYWPGAYGDDKVPLCTSMDGNQGMDRETGEIRACATCPYNQYGTGKDSKGNDSRGKACKNMRRLYLLRPGDVIPMILTLPPTSLAAYDKYRTTLALGVKKFYSVMTRFSLQKAQNEDGIAYSKVGFEATGALPIKEAERIKAYADSILGAAEKAGVTADDYDAGDAQPAAKDTPENQKTSAKAKAFMDKVRADSEKMKQGENVVEADGFINVDEDELPDFDVPGGK